MGRGSQTSQTKIPEWLSSAAKSALGRANTVAGIGPTPYYGPDVAALSPLQEAARANLNAGASAFGMAPAASSGLPEAQTFAGGVRGYSSAPLYEAAVNELKTRYPGQYNAIMGQFIDPVTGALPSWLQPTAAAQPTASAMQPTSAQSDRSAAEIAALAPHQGGRSFASTGVAARLPGGVNTRNPASVTNQAVARMTQTSSKPTKSDRPKANPRRP